MKNRRMWIFLIAAIALYAIMGMYADFGKISLVMSQFKWLHIVLLFVLTSIGYVIRYVKWHLLMKNINSNITANASLFVFISGLSMVITPARIGEIWKAWLVKEISGDEMSKTIPVVIIDRVTDAVSLIILSFTGVFYYTSSANILIGALCICFIIYFAIHSKYISGKLISLVELMFEKYVNNIRDMHNTLLQLLKPKNFLIALLLSGIAWSMECLGLYVVVTGFGSSISALFSVFIFSFTSLVGGVSMLPGGIGVAEIGIVGLLMSIGISNTIAVAVAMILRIGSFWYGIVLGTLTYVLCKGKFLKVKGVKDV